ncbi:MAG TPA: cupredoxin domain-containing protein [Nitrososphaeraceae archaeon]|nr:cupredoxin domain-containing protein [Nitrososphaeraceae archaeon]
MTDWDLITPGIGLTSIGIVGVGVSLSGIAHTFTEGMHAVSLLTMFIGLIFLAAGIFKDGFPTSARAKSATFITLGFLVTFGLAAAITISTRIPSIFAYIGLMLIISIPATVLTVASYKRTPYFKAIAVIFVIAAVVGASTFYVFGLVTPKAQQEDIDSAEAKQNETSSVRNITNLVKSTILPGSSAQGNPSFEPVNLKVPKDGGIEWTNNDNVPHTVTSLIDDGKTFDSKTIKPNATYILDAMNLKDEQYDYFCTLHPHMKGKITVG